MFPYEYLSSHAVFKETSLPGIEDFDSSLGIGDSVSLADFQHAKNVWDVFKCRNFQDYTELYCELDVILLAELYSHFKDNCKKVRVL